jgi:hypothetical protein
MKTSVKGSGARAPKKRTPKAAKIADKDLAQLAAALESGARLELKPPQPEKPERDPQMWSKLFGMWS